MYLPQVEVEVAGNRKLEHTGVKVELIGLIGVLRASLTKCPATKHCCLWLRYIRATQSCCKTAAIPTSSRRSYGSSSRLANLLPPNRTLLSFAALRSSMSRTTASTCVSGALRPISHAELCRIYHPLIREHRLARFLSSGINPGTLCV